MTTVPGSQEVNKKDLAIRIGIGVALSALSGVMLLLSFPPYGIWPLAWFALVPGVFAQHRLLPAKWASLAPALYSGIWLGPFLARLFGSEFGPVFQYLGVLIGILNFFLAKERKFHELTGYRWFILQGVINWVGFEMVRATVIPVIATSAFIGYTQATQAWVIQPVSIFSGLTVVFMISRSSWVSSEAVSSSIMPASSSILATSDSLRICSSCWLPSRPLISASMP